MLERETCFEKPQAVKCELSAKNSVVFASIYATLSEKWLISEEKHPNFC